MFKLTFFLCIRGKCSNTGYGPFTQSICVASPMRLTMLIQTIHTDH